MGKKILIIRTAMLLVGLSTLPALFVHCANKGFTSNSSVDPTVNGSVYQPPPGGDNSNYTCASTVPCSNGISCALSIGRPAMENQAWQKDATTCGFSCINDWTGPMCGTNPGGGGTYSCQGTAPAFANLCDGDETGLTANGTRSAVSICTPNAKCEYTCRPGYNFENGECKLAVGNTCSTTKPACSPVGCALNTGNPTSPGQAWVYQAANCGFSCINGYSGTNCATPPTYTCQGTIPQNSVVCDGAEAGLTANGNRVLVGACSSAKCEYKCADGFTKQGNSCVSSNVNSCATPDPCISNSTCLIVRNATSPNQQWSTTGNSCSYTCINGYSGAGCSTAPGSTLPNPVTCTAAVQQLPTVTHWSNTTKFTIGANERFPIANTTDLMTSRKIYGSDLVPKFNEYIADKYEIEPITNAEWTGWTSAECQTTGMAIEVRKPDSYTDWGVARNAIVEARGSIQILHALIMDNNLVTIILPPNWKKSDAPKKYPIMATTSYDLKGNIMARNHLIVQSMALAYNAGKPFIGVIWNGGGAIGSRNMNQESRQWFNNIMLRVAAHFGGNPERIFMFGASRGGAAALLVASNPGGFYGYKVVAAYAGVPPTDFYSNINFTGATYPGMIAAAEWSIGLLDTWKSNFTYPNLGNSMTGLNRNQAHLHILTGSSSQSALDNELSISSTRILQGLKDQGTRLYIELGSHDINVPWIDQFRFMKALNRVGVPHELRLNYLTGHWVDTSSNVAILSKTKFADIMKNISDGTFTNIFRPGTKSYYMNDYNSTSLSAVTTADRFTFETPRFQTPSTAGHFVFTGLPKTKVKATFSFNGVDGEPAETELNDDGYLIIPQNDQLVGTFILKKLEIKKDANSAWKELDMRMGTTSKGRGVITYEVKANDPPADTSAAGVATSIIESYLDPVASNKGTNGFREVSYGLCEQ